MDEPIALRKPVWPRSGKLWPQSRQFPDQYAEDLVTAAVTAVAPVGWGFRRLVVEEAALAEGVVRLVQAEGRFPSGAPLLVQPATALTRSLPREGHSTSVLVSVGVGRAVADAPNVTDDPEDHAPVRHLRAQRDAGSTLSPNLRLLFDDEGGEAYERMPLARIALGGNAALDRWFVPPMLRVLPDSSLARGVRSVVAALVRRREALLVEREGRPLDLHAFAAPAAPHLLLLTAIQRALALLDHATWPDVLAPAELYGLLAGLAADLESLDGRALGPGGAYVHEASGPGFRSLLERLLALVPSVARSTHDVLPLQRIDPATFVLRIADPEPLRRRAYLVASGVIESASATHLPVYAKIGSSQSVPTLISTATRGAALALEFDPPSFLPSSALHCPFRIDVRSPYWAEALQTRALMVHVPDAPGELMLALYVPHGDPR